MLSGIDRRSRLVVAAEPVLDRMAQDLVDTRFSVLLEEPFGPILPLLKWRDEADVIARANDTRYGLGASVWGRDLDAVQRIGRQIQAGTVWLNEVHQYTPYQVFGGHKQSGIGAENSLHGLGEYTNWQSITLNKDPDAV